MMSKVYEDQIVTPYEAAAPVAPQHMVMQPLPGQTEFMPPPAPVPGCPPGLEYLSMLDQVLLRQQIELLEAMTNFETRNRYSIKNSVGQQCYFAHEESGLCERVCCGPHRGFQMHIQDNTGQEVIRTTRQFKCCAGCCWFANHDGCSYSIDVEAPVGTVIGSIRQSQSCWIPHYSIHDQNAQQIFTIKGPCCVLPGPCCMCDFHFEILDKNSTSVGKITKVYGGLGKEMFTTATNFNLSFPKDLDVKIKAVLLGATFLIDMMFFERKNK